MRCNVFAACAMTSAGTSGSATRPTTWSPPQTAGQGVSYATDAADEARILSSLGLLYGRTNRPREAEVA